MSDSNVFDPNKDYSIREIPEKDYMNPVTSFFVNLLERLYSKFSVHKDVPVYDNDTYPWVKEVEAEWHLIRKELDEVMNRRDELPNFQDIMAEVGNINKDNDWKTFFLMGYDNEAVENAKRCPETVRILNKIPGVKTAFFSILSPGKHIPPHRGPYNGVLRYHLGLMVPEPKEQCRIRIGNDIRYWEEGKSIVFDDTFNHQVWNDTDGFRAILFVDFVRPLRVPFNLLNNFLLNVARDANFMKEADQRQKNWEKEFYKN